MEKVSMKNKGKKGVSEAPATQDVLDGIIACAESAGEPLNCDLSKLTPDKVIKLIDKFVCQWQKGNRPAPEVLEEEDAPFIMGSLWGQQLAKRFGWEWGMITFHDHGDSVAPAIISKDRSLVIYPMHFLTGCFQDPDVDATIELSYNLLKEGKLTEFKPGQYFNFMDGVHRIVPKD